MKTVTPEAVGFSSERLRRVKPVMQTYVDQKKLPGLITLVARQGKVVHFEKYGLMDIETNKPIQTDTIFRIYSMTKPITTVAAMMLYEEGHFLLSDPVSKFIPAFKDVKVFGNDSDGSIELVELEREMTIHDLMTHTSGLTYAFIEDSPVDTMYAQAGLFNRDKTLQENVQELVKMPLVHHPGAAWRYSVSTDVLGYLIEMIADTSLDSFLKEHVFDPLQMIDTGFYVPQEKIDRFAALYNLTEDGELELMAPPATGDYTKPPQNLSGGGGLVSTMTDYLRFAQMLLNGGELDGIRLLGRKTVTLMTTNRLPEQILPITIPILPLHAFGFGLGFEITMSVTDSQGFESVGNYGWGGAASTHFWIDPQEEVIGLLMTQFMPTGHYPLEEQLKVLTYQALID